MNITIIAAISSNRCIGSNGKIPWSLPNDFKRFKKLTSGHTIIMGRKTFESLPGVLPDRTHIVITRQKEIPNAGDCIVVHSLEEALKLCPQDDESFIIGGEEIYREGLKYADKIELTNVQGEFLGDAYFPEIDLKIWKGEVISHNTIDEFHKLEYTYVTFRKR